MLLQAVLVGSLALLLLCAYFRYSSPGRQLVNLPGPTPLPIIGNALDMSLDPVKLFSFCRVLSKEYGGSIARLCGLNMGLVCIYEPEDLEVILSSTKFNNKYYPYNFLEPWLGKGLLTNNGERWQQRRKLLTPAFHFSILRQFQWSLAARTRQLVARAEDQLAAPSTHVSNLITPTTLGIMCDTSMGNTAAEDSHTYFESLHSFGKCAVHRLARVWLYPDFLYSLSPYAKEQDTAVKNLHRFTTRVIQRRRESKGSSEASAGEDEVGGRSKRAMLDLLLEHEREGNIDAEGIREEVDTFMFEGHDTTSASLCFMIMRIANEPVIQDRIYQELEHIFGESDRDPSMEDLGEMKYLERCIKESLRLYPGVPYISRYLTQEVVLHGHTIPPNVTVGIHIFDIHRNSRQFPEPERFDPDRFLAERAALRHTYAYIPFSAGPRNCIGQKFAMLEMKTVMAGLLRRFRLEPVTRPEDVIFVSDLVLRSKDPIYVRFRNRK